MPTNWTAIVPVAGKGSRLSNEIPKVVYPVAGKPLISYALESLQTIARIIFVCSPTNIEAVTPHVEELESTHDYRVMRTIQPEPCGTADAVNCGMDYVATEYTMVLWGDQIVLDQTVITRGMEYVQGLSKFDVAIPVAWTDNPYVNIVIDDGIVRAIGYSREGDLMPAYGYADMGVFFFRTTVLRRILSEYLSSGIRGALSREANFPSILTRIKRQMVYVVQYGDTIGINTQRDVVHAEFCLGLKQ